MTVVSFLEDHPDADERAIREALSGHLCRCTGYQGIVDAVMKVARGSPAAMARRQA
jgi:carbon-monoxide dehydrogenase small subunit